MTDRKTELNERLQREFEVCERHILRIKEAIESLDVELPMSSHCYNQLTAEQVRSVDQFIFRFSKLQDVIGSKVFRYVLELMDEEVTYLPMRDILNRLERYNLIPSAADWVYMRELRNEIAHDYPLMENDEVSIINELIAKTETLIHIFCNLKEVANK